MRSQFSNKADISFFFLFRLHFSESVKMSSIEFPSRSKSASAYSLDTFEPREDLHFQHKDPNLLLHNTQIPSRKDRNRILYTKPLSRWLGTVFFILAIIATLLIYQRKRNYSSTEKKNFVAATTALVLCLGLNFFCWIIVLLNFRR